VILAELIKHGAPVGECMQYCFSDPFTASSKRVLEVVLGAVPAGGSSDLIGFIPIERCLNLCPTMHLMQTLTIFIERGLVVREEVL